MTTQSVPNRRSIRLPEYDYSEPGAYFVTINCHNRRAFFGRVIGEKVLLNKFGQIAKKCWQVIPNHFPAVAIDAFVIMPNHVHGILLINETSADRVRAQHAAPIPKSADHVRARHASPLPKPRGAQSGSLGSIIGSYKSAVTREINILRNHADGPVWHRNYYERVVRNDRELGAIRHYITYNAVKPVSSKREFE